LAASLRKSSAISASTAARSQRLGQAQSKSQSGLEAADMRVLQPPLQAAAMAFLFLPRQQRRQPVLGCDLAPVRQQTVQMQRLGAGAQGLGTIHRRRP
jgi:hypothetical protein